MLEDRVWSGKPITNQVKHGSCSEHKSLRTILVFLHMKGTNGLNSTPIHSSESHGHYPMGTGIKQIHKSPYKEELEWLQMTLDNKVGYWYPCSILLLDLWSSVSRDTSTPLLMKCRYLGSVLLQSAAAEWCCRVLLLAPIDLVSSDIAEICRELLCSTHPVWKSHGIMNTELRHALLTLTAY